MENNIQVLDKKAERKERRKVARQATRAFSRIFFSLVVYILVAGLVLVAAETVLLLALGEEGAVAAMEKPYVMWGLRVLAMYIVAFPLFLKMVKKLPRKDIEKSSMGFGSFIGTFFICQAAMLIGNLISTYLVEFISGIMGHEIPNTTSDLILESPLWLVILVAVIIGPIVEELIFRKAIIDRTAMYGEKFSVAVSALAFGLFHGNLSQLIYATMFGSILGWVYVKTGKIKNTCILHIIINFFGSVPAILLNDKIQLVSEMAMEESIADMETFMAALVPVAIYSILQYMAMFIGIAIYIKRRDNDEMKLSKIGDIQISGWRRFRCAVLNFGALLFYAFSAYTIMVTLMMPAVA